MRVCLAGLFRHQDADWVAETVKAFVSGEAVPSVSLTLEYFSVSLIKGIRPYAAMRGPVLIVSSEQE